MSTANATNERMPVAACEPVYQGTRAPNSALGARTVIGVADRTGGIINESGLDVPALRHHVKARPPFGGTLRTFPGGAHGPGLGV